MEDPDLGKNEDAKGAPAPVKVLPAFLQIPQTSEFLAARAAFNADPISGLELPKSPLSETSEERANDNSSPESEGTAALGTVPSPNAPQKSRLPRLPRRKRRARSGFWLVPSLIFLMLGLLFAGLGLSGKPLRLPVWAVVEAETRINRMLADISGQENGGTALSLGGAVFVVDKDWVPRLRLEDLRLLRPDGGALLTLPELRIALDTSAITEGKLRLRSLRVIGARLGLTRREDGQFDIALGRGMKPRPVKGFAGLIDAVVGAFDHPALSNLRKIEADALTLTIDDRQLGRIWEMGDGRLRLDNRADELAVELGVSLDGGSAIPAQATLTLIAAKKNSEARITVSVDRVAAADIAAQAAPLAWLGVLDAPISGQFVSNLDAQGALSALDATLNVAAGSLLPTPETKPVTFDSAALFFSYNPARERLDLRELSVQSKTLRLTAAGHAYLPGVAAGLPDHILAQVQFSEVAFDPDGIFAEPARFEQGALDMRLRLSPFSVDIGQLSLLHEGRHLSASGNVSARSDGWTVGLDVALDEIAHDRLLALWPERAVPKTRKWVAENVQEGFLTNVHAAFRAAPGAEPRLSLGYDYSGADVRFLKTLPPIIGGQGYAVVEGKSYTLVLNRGHLNPAIGGAIDVAGSVFAVENVTQKPAQARISLKTKGSLTATLSLLDEPPFKFLTKANQPVTLGKGNANATAILHMPLRKGVKINDVRYEVKGQISNFSSETLVPGRRLEADFLTIEASPEGLEISGKGKLQGVPFDAKYSKKFSPEFKGISQVTGTAELSQSAVDRLRLGLPAGLLQGTGSAQITVDLNKGSPPRLSLTSNLSGLGLSIPAMGWSKPKNGVGNLTIGAQLAKPAIVDRLEIDAAGLRASGNITLKPEGGLNLAQFSSVKLGGWLDASVDLTGRGKGRAPDVSVTGGTVDLRGLNRGKGGGGQGSSTPLNLALNQLIVSDGLSLMAFRGNVVAGKGGLTGEFTGRVNGQAPIQGSLVPSANGTAARIRSTDAGAVFSAAKIFPNAQGGTMDLVLKPLDQSGSYDGNLSINGIRIRKAPALAELINAISVVGLLDQLNGTGLLFSESEVEFRLTPRAIQITRGSATGASIGVSVAGLYVLQGGRLDMQGVISPIYILNGLGALFTRKGEGLFGFNYHIQGTAKQPSVSVNPLSILTPGMFREIFRAAPPKLEPGE